MADEKVPYTAFLQDESKLALGKLDLFDRVINLRLVFAERGVDASGKSTYKESEYVIRSDFETYFPGMLQTVADADMDGYKKLRRCMIRKCQYKPSIKVQYKRVSMDVPVEIDIFIENFFMLDTDGNMLKTFNNISNSLVQVDIAMGYYGQFREAYAGKGKIADIGIDKLFDFQKSTLSGAGITKITISDAVYVQTDKLPPDMTVHIHGFVGNLYSEKLSALVSDETEETNTRVVDYDSFKKTSRLLRTSEADPSKTFLEWLFFEQVTRNWARQGEISVIEEEAERILAQVASHRKAERMIATSLSKEDAEAYGIHVYFSAGAKAFAEDYDKIHKLVSAGYAEYKGTLSIESATTAMQKVNVLKNVLGMKDFVTTPLDSTGDILLYMKDETVSPEDMWKGTEVEGIYKDSAVETFWQNKIPAVYNITTDALCTVVCPFYFFIDPFQKFYFKTRYALGGLVSYYANFNASEDEFYALWQTISFATVEDINECTIVCTGQRRGG